MTIKTISYQKIYPTGMAYLNHKIGVEISVDENDDWEAAFDLAKKFVDEMNIKSNPGMAAAMEYMKPSESIIDHKKEEMKEMINDCKSKEELIQFQDYAFKYKLETEYLTKLKSFA